MVKRLTISNGRLSRSWEKDLHLREALETFSRCQMGAVAATGKITAVSSVDAVHLKTNNQNKELMR
jgi:hypothetical protein